MAEALTGDKLISPAQLAHLRASLYADRAVTNGEVRVLLEAYDTLVREVAAARQATVA